MADRYKEKTREGDKTRELDCPDGYRGIDGKCVKMSAKEMRNRSKAAHRSKRSHGNKQKYIDDKRNDTIKNNEGVSMNDKLRQIIREEITSIIYEDTKSNYVSALKSHDWNFNYADDGRAYRRGTLERQDLLDMIPRLDFKTAKTLWAKYAPKAYPFPYKTEPNVKLRVDKSRFMDSIESAFIRVISPSGKTLDIKKHGVEKLGRDEIKVFKKLVDGETEFSKDEMKLMLKMSKR